MNNMPDIMERPLIYNFLNDDDLLRISNLITKMEKGTSGEICVSIKEKRDFKDRKKTLKETAVREFFRLGINSTKDKTGVLILIILKSREFYILADEGINKLMSENTWDNIKDEMQRSFKEGNFCKGILSGVESVGTILSSRFPIKPGDKNELSNRVIIK